MFIHLLRLIIQPTAALTAIHSQQGDLFNTHFFNKKLLFVSKPEYFEEIFSQEARGLLSRDSLYNAKKPVFGDGLFNSKTETWTQQRRLMQPFFTRQAISQWQDIMLEEVNDLIIRLKSCGDTEVNLSKEIKTVIQKILIRVFFGRQQVDQGDEQLMGAIDAIVKGLFPHFVTETLGKGQLKPLFYLQNRRMTRAISQFVGYVEAEIERNRRESNTQGLLSLLMQSRDKTGYSMPNDLLKDEAVTLFLAGQDTSVNTLAWFFYLIGKNAAVHQKISDEIKQFAAEALSFDLLEKLSYTKAALYETLRLYPQAIALSRDSTDTIQVGGERIAKETTVIMSVYVTQRDQRFWQHPHAFYPEHFLTDEAKARHKYAFLPFGAGMHNCIGKHFAELEMLLIIVAMLRVFKVETQAEIKPTLSITYKPERDVKVKLRPV